MSLGRRKTERQGEFWIATQDLAGGPGHIFYDRLNKLLDEAGFVQQRDLLLSRFRRAERDQQPDLLRQVDFTRRRPLR